jgi:CubicO group peptidase (beta-lactamase class C family)
MFATKRLLSVTLLLLLLAPAGFAQTLDYTLNPDEVGFAPDRLKRITDTLNAGITSDTLPGATLLIARHGKIAYFETFGALDPQTKTPMPKDAIFRIYSMSKPITSVAAMILVEEGKLFLEDPVAKYLPQFKDVKVAVNNAPGTPAGTAMELVAPNRPMTVQDLMRHTSGITYGFFGDTPVKKMYVEAKVFIGDFTNAEFADRIAKMPLSYQPGTTWDYSHSTDILGRIIEVVSKKSLYEFEKERILAPLGMDDTSFYVTDPAKQGLVAEPFASDRVFGIDAVMNDPRIAGKWESGGGGMVSTTKDYASFLQMLLDGGVYDGHRILSPETVAFMTSDHLGSRVVPGPYYLPGPGYGFGLGFAVRREAGISALPSSVGTYLWGGAGGTAFWSDPKRDFFVVFMMQSPKQRLHYRALLADMVYAALVEPER